MHQTYTKNFQCEYMLHRYPFDVQTCSINMMVHELDEDNIRLIPGQIKMKEKKLPTMYVVYEPTIIYQDEDNPKTGIKMLIVFKRRIMNELLTTYLPSILLI